MTQDSYKSILGVKIMVKFCGKECQENRDDGGRGKVQNRKVKGEDKNNPGSCIEIFRIIEQVYLSQQFLGISVKIAIFILKSFFKSLNIFGIFDLFAQTLAFDYIQYILFQQRKAGNQRKEAFSPQTILFF